MTFKLEINPEVMTLFQFKEKRQTAKPGCTIQAVAKFLS